MSKRIYILGVLLLFVAAVSSCRYNELEPDQHSAASKPSGNRIAFELGTAQSVVPQTKGFAGEQQGAKSFLCVEGSDSIYLAYSVVDNNDPVFVPAAPVVKGAPVTTENMTEFYVTANLSPEQQYFPITRVDESDKSDGVYTLDYYWPQDSLDFFAANFYPTGTAVQTRSSSVEEYNSSIVDWADYVIEWAPSVTTFGYDGKGKPVGTFSYSLPEPNVDVNRDAEVQPDYAFAIASSAEADLIESNNGNVPLRFAHCFTAVTFKLGSEFLDPTGRQVKKVEVVGVPSSGECTFYPDQNRNMVYEWDTEGAALKDYAQVIPLQFDGSTNIDSFGVINDGEMTFMLIPHEIRPDAKIRVTIQLHADRPEYAHEMVIEKDIASLFADIEQPKVWRAGKKYIYTFLSEEVVDIDIRDEFINNAPVVKGNVITNTGTSSVYVRAYVVGWWEDESGIIVAPWTVTDGNFTGTGWANDGFTFSGEGSDWKVGPDGFFYYQELLSPDEEASELFETYTLTVDPPVLGSRLILNIVTQAILHYRVNEVEVWSAMINATPSSTQSEGYIYDSLSWK